MSAKKNNDGLENLGNALKRLDEALREPKDAPLVLDGTIQRFEFVIELFWKTLMRLLANEGIQCATPREAINGAFRAGWIEDEKKWLDMITDRNATSHVYNQAQALHIYERILKHAPILRKAYKELRKRFAG
ncbi:MAG: nucleotidyltransferase substrate binding protein [Candidatus Hydrogenedentes bacterium]|nr:nucleotidyltransferase substrate binding protein [Candidatus Hydrogenedentota bacterium]